MTVFQTLARFLALCVVLVKSEEQLEEDTNPNSFDIWNPKEWLSKNQEGVAPGEIRFCYTAWNPFTIEKQSPRVIKCYGNDVLWLSYQIHIQNVHKNQFQTLNDNFTVVVTHGDECEKPFPDLGDASFPDCINREEHNVILGEKCVRKNIAVNTYATNVACFIIYCGNLRSHCDLWVRSYWTKFFKVNPSMQTIRPGTEHIYITGQNFASNVSLIQTKCADEEQRIMPCNCSWVDEKTGTRAMINFSKPIDRRHTGVIFLRMDSDDAGWSTAVPIAVVIEDIYPWISMTVMMTTFLSAMIPFSIACVFWTCKDRYQNYKRKKEKQLKVELEAVNRGIDADDAMDFQLPGWS